MVASTHLGAPVCLVVGGRHAECDALVAQLRKRCHQVLLAHTPFEAVVKATFHEPGVILLDPSLGRGAIGETQLLLAQCPITALLPVLELTPSRIVPVDVLAALAA